MDGENSQLHILFFPFLAHGHMIPMVDMAQLFAARGVKATIVTTPLNLPFVSQTIERAETSGGVKVDIRTIKFPVEEAGLPAGYENIDSVTSEETKHNFIKAVRLLRQPFEPLLNDSHADCLVADVFFPWATDAAAKFGIPRLVFIGTSFFSMSVENIMMQYKPYKNVLSDSETFVIPNFPGEIKLTRMQLADFTKQEVETEFTKFIREAVESESSCYGVVVNSFYELEPTYADYYRRALGRKAWHIGPLSLCNKDGEVKARRGKEASVDAHECLRWLNTKKTNSVVYLCFGSLSDFTDCQLMEIAMGLEASGQQFIWVVRKGKNEREEEDWLPKGFEKRMEEKGLIIRGWAPQVLILDHHAVGGFVTHCGWNSILEGVAAGVPMVTWPLFADQFCNEKLVTDVLKIGVRVGVQRCVEVVGDFVKKEAVEKAVKQLMVGEEAEEIRMRAKALGEKARRVVEEGGSSYSDLSSLIEELRSRCR